MVANQRNQDGRFCERLLQLFGATPSSRGGYAIRTTLAPDELPAFWLALAADMVNAGLVRGIHECPVARTCFGLRLLSPALVDIFFSGASAPTSGTPQLAHHLAPYLVLAGLPGSGKSALRRALTAHLNLPQGLTYTTRTPRTGDDDFQTGRYRPADTIDSRSQRRRAALSLPVRFRQNDYHFALAEAFVSRFDSTHELVLQFDSHPLRIDWLRALMPDIRIIWLEAAQATLFNREAQRGTAPRPLTADYKAACARTRATAELVVSTDQKSPEQIAEQIVAHLGLPSGQS